jgi:curli biogenesis system outer membrane secretion channel CsgG
MTRGLLFLLAGVTLATAGCGGVRAASKKDYDWRKLERVAIVSFAVSDEGARADEVADAFVIGLMKAGFHVVEREKLSQVLEEKKLALMGVTEENRWLKAGELLDVDAILTGTISRYKAGGKAWFGTGVYLFESEVEINARLIEVTTGSILWAAAHRDACQERATARDEVVSKLCESLGKVRERASTRGRVLADSK